MNTLTIDVGALQITDVHVNGVELTIDLADGRTISVPIGWYPRLSHGTNAERKNWRLIGGGHGISWPDLDEDISAENIISGSMSGESQRSFGKWLEKRNSKSKK